MEPEPEPRVREARLAQGVKAQEDWKALGRKLLPLLAGVAQPFSCTKALGSGNASFRVERSHDRLYRCATREKQGHYSKHVFMIQT